MLVACVNPRGRMIYGSLHVHVVRPFGHRYTHAYAREVNHFWRTTLSLRSRIIIIILQWNFFPPSPKKVAFENRIFKRGLFPRIFGTHFVFI